MEVLFRSTPKHAGQHCPRRIMRVKCRTMTGAEIEDRIKNPKTYKITKIQVLRARGQLPENEQVGATCGIYALEAAFDIKGIIIAPRKRVFGDWRSQGYGPTHSIRGKANAMNLSKIAELGAAADRAP